MKVRTHETKIYIIELTEEEKERFFKRMLEPDMNNHSYSILGEIYSALRDVTNGRN